MRPDAQRPGTGQLEQSRQQRRPEAATPMRRVHDQLGDPVVEPGVTGECAAVPDEHVLPAGRTAVLEPELGLLREGADAVGGRGRPQQGEDLVDLALLQVVAQLLPQTNSESTADSGAAARAAAAVASATCWSSL